MSVLIYLKRVKSFFLLSILSCHFLIHPTPGISQTLPTQSSPSNTPDTSDSSEEPLHQEEKPTHAIATRSAPKHGPNFTHFNIYNPHAPKGGILRIPVIGTMFDTLNPFTPRGICAKGLGLYNYLPFDTLMERSPEEPQAFYPRLAKQVRLAPDRSSITFFLDPSAKFQDGTPVTARDVAYTFRMLSEHGTPSRRMLGKRIKEVVTKGRHEITFFFHPLESGSTDQELPFLIANMTVLSKKDLEGRNFEKTGLTPLLGSGPYKIANVDPGRSITFERDPDYWGRNLPSLRGLYNFDKIIYEYYGTDSVAFEAFKAGDLDHWSESNPSRWRCEYNFPAVRDGRVAKEELQFSNASIVTTLIFNTQKAILSNPLTRKALSLLFDVQWINRILMDSSLNPTDSFFGDTVFAARGTPSPEEKAIIDGLPEVPQEILGPLPHFCPNDGSGNLRPQIKEAQRLLKKAGWTFKGQQWVDTEGRPLMLELIVSDPKNERFAMSYARVLAKIGIPLRVRVVDSAQYQKRTDNREFDLLFYTYGTSMSPGTEQKLYWLSSFARVSSRNYAGIESKAIDTICDTILNAKTSEEQVIRMRVLDRLLRHGFYMRPLFNKNKERIAYRKSIQHPICDGTSTPTIYSWWSTQKSATS